VDDGGEHRAGSSYDGKPDVLRADNHSATSEQDAARALKSRAHIFVTYVTMPAASDAGADARRSKGDGDA
jgi:hypothetical protein